METLKKLKYAAPMILEVSRIEFETAQSWNRGYGNEEHPPGDGNGGTQYPHEPR